MRNKFKNLFNFLVRLFVALWLMLYGVVKLAGLQLSHFDVDVNLKDLHPTGLMWYFFSYSPIYSKFIAISQLVSAIFLLIPKTRTLGALFATIVTLNILVINISFEITIYTLLLSLILFICCIYLVILDKHKFARLLEK